MNIAFVTKASLVRRHIDEVYALEEILMKTDQDTRAKNQEPRIRDHGPKPKKQGSRIKNQGPRTNDQGPQGPRTKGVGH